MGHPDLPRTCVEICDPSQNCLHVLADDPPIDGLGQHADAPVLHFSIGSRSPRSRNRRTRTAACSTRSGGGRSSCEPGRRRGQAGQVARPRSRRESGPRRPGTPHLAPMSGGAHAPARRDRPRGVGLRCRRMGDGSDGFERGRGGSLRRAGARAWALPRRDHGRGAVGTGAHVPE